MLYIHNKLFYLKYLLLYFWNKVTVQIYSLNYVFLYYLILGKFPLNYTMQNHFLSLVYAVDCIQSYYFTQRSNYFNFFLNYSNDVNYLFLHHYKNILTPLCNNYFLMSYFGIEEGFIVSIKIIYTKNIDNNINNKLIHGWMGNINSNNNIFKNEMNSLWNNKRQ